MSKYKEYNAEIKFRLPEADAELFRQICRVKKWSMSDIFRNVIEKVNRDYGAVVVEEKK